MNEYVPGKHNITKEAAKKRSRTGWKALLIVLLYVVVIYALNLPQFFMLVVGIPLLLGTRLLLEGKSRFSATYGLHGLYDDGSGVKHTKEEGDAQYDDRVKAQSMLVFSTAVAVVGALFCYVALV